MKRRLSINAILLFLLVAIFLGFHRFLSGDWENEFIDRVLDMIGLSLICFGFLLRISSRGYKAEKTGGGDSLVVDGPYSLTRNPMYAGTLVIGLGITLFLWKWWLIFVLALLFFIRYLPQIKQEERSLLLRFGEDYESYCRRTPRFLPSLTSLFKQNTRNLLPIKYKWIKREALSFVIVAVICFVVELHKDVSHYGKAVYVREALLLLDVVLCFVLLFSFLSRRTEVI